jgi:hypothetical protein
MVTFGLPHAPTTGAAAIPVLNHWLNVWVPSAWHLPTRFTRAPSALPVTSCVLVQPRPGVNGLPLMNDVTPEISQLSVTEPAGLLFIFLPRFGRE